MALAIVVLAAIGWLTGETSLVSVDPSRVSMKVNTVATLGTTALALLLRTSSRPKVAAGAAVLASVPIGIGLLTLSQYVVGTELGIDQLLAPDVRAAAETVHPGRMAVNTAVCGILLGATLIGWRAPASYRGAMREALAIPAGAIGLVALIGHVYGATALYQVDRTAMAINSAAAIVLLSIAVILPFPQGPFMCELASRQAGGFMARRLLPAALVLPIVLGWLRLLGERRAYYGTPTGATILVAANAFLIASAIWWYARLANKLDREHERTIRALEDVHLERELRERFVRGLAHDLRSPLASIRAGAERLGRLERDDLHRRLGAVVVGGVDRLDRMIHDLLDVERIRAGHGVPLDVERCDAAEIAEDVVRELSVVHGDRFVLQLDPSSGCWSRDAIRRVIENLLTNALKYGEADAPITVRTSTCAHTTMIEVHNQGPPLPPDERESLFDAFRRGRSATDGVRVGWGIGLTLVRGYVEAHGGRVEVESGDSQGTTFRVVLPEDARPFVPHRTTAPSV